MTRDQIGKWVLGVLAALLVAVATWTARTLWASKLDVADYGVHLSKDALHDQLDSVWHVEQGKKMDEVLCTLKPHHKGC